MCRNRATCSLERGGQGSGKTVKRHVSCRCFIIPRVMIHFADVVGRALVELLGIQQGCLTAMTPRLAASVGLLVLGALSSADVARSGSGKLNVHLVCHTHDDPGWLKVPNSPLVQVQVQYEFRPYTRRGCPLRLCSEYNQPRCYSREQIGRTSTAHSCVVL